MSKKTEKKTIIIGGGIVGATLALKLAQAQCPVTLVDARPKLGKADWEKKLSQRDARVYALSLASIELLKEVGAWSKVAASGRKADYQQMQVWQQDGMGELKFADEHSTALLGSMVEPFVIEEALYARFDEADVTAYLEVISGHKVVSMDWLGEAEGYRVDLDNGDSHQAKLLVGADGRGSFVRRQAGIALDTLDYQQTAICCAIRTAKPHCATARQAMLPTGTLAMLPLADMTNEDKAEPQHWQSIVWTLPRNQAYDMLTLDDRALADELAFASGYALGEIQKIESIASFDLSAQQAQTYVKDNLALVGDAAHGVHPLAGQGLNLGMLDVDVLVAELLNDRARSGGKLWGHEQTLSRYQRLRRPNNSMMMHSFSAINWLFAGTVAQMRPVQQLRDFGMYHVGKSALAMRLFAKKASGGVS